MILNQLGVGPSAGFTIYGETETWDDFLPEGEQLELVKTYMALKVRLMFDTSVSSSVNSAIQEQIKEFEWRLNVAVDPNLQGG